MNTCLLSNRLHVFCAGVMWLD